MRARQGDQVLAPAPGAPTLLPQSNPCRADPYTVAGAPLSAARLTRPCSSDPGAAPASRPLYLASHMPRRPSLGPSREIDDEHDEQNDDQKANQSVAGSSNGEHAEHGASLRFDCREVACRWSPSNEERPSKRGAQRSPKTPAALLAPIKGVQASADPSPCAPGSADLLSQVGASGRRVAVSANKQTQPVAALTMWTMPSARSEAVTARGRSLPWGASARCRSTGSSQARLARSGLRRPLARPSP